MQIRILFLLIQLIANNMKLYRYTVLLFIMLCGTLFNTTANAHPHAFIGMNNHLLVKNGQLIGFKMQWIFDDASSATMIYDIKRSDDPEKMAETLSHQVMQNIINQHYFSELYDSRQLPIKFTSKPDNYALKIAGKQIIFEFRFYLAHPINLRKQSITMLTFDPSYYVAMSYPNGQKNLYFTPINQCTINLEKANVNQKMKDYANSLDQSDTPDEDLSLGKMFAQQLKIECP